MKTRFTFTLLCLPFLIFAQSNEEKEAVMKPVKQLFEAMQKSDSALLRKHFN
ncbi:MAG: hypothetical protein QM734_00630 [Cyclobacteriaceae bacterium]